jgi:hypothetical protein
MTEDDLNSDMMRTGERIAKMWLDLGNQLAGAIPEMVLNGHALDAIRTATYAEACFWKSTGEADAHDIKDIIPPLASEEGQHSK